MILCSNKQLIIIVTDYVTGMKQPKLGVGSSRTIRKDDLSGRAIGQSRGLKMKIPRSP
jgi:hypothetical protein